MEKQIDRKNKEYKTKKKAVRKLRRLLLRVWFIKNWFTLFVVITTAAVVATFSGIIPESFPVIGTLSITLKGYFKEFLSIGEAEYMQLFGSLTGIFSILFSLGYLSSNIQTVSYSMINKKKLSKILSEAKLTVSQKGKIVSIEKRVGLDLDGDNKIGTTQVDMLPRDNIITDIVTTFNELTTILSIDDDVLKEVHKEHTNNKTKEEETIEVVDRKPSTKYRPPGF